MAIFSGTAALIVEQEAGHARFFKHVVPFAFEALDRLAAMREESHTGATRLDAAQQHLQLWPMSP